MTDPVPEPSNANHPIDPAARLLRQMLDALAAHRQSKADPETEDKIVRLDFGLVIKPQPPRWIRQMEAAAGDGVEQSLVASIREEAGGPWPRAALKPCATWPTGPAVITATCFPSSTTAGTVSVPAATAIGCPSGRHD
jgi:hypothetical protein